MKARRDEAGLSGPGLAAQLGWGKAKISKIENGKQLPSATDIKLWCQATDADTATERSLLDLLSEAHSVRLTWRQRLQENGQAGVQADYSTAWSESTTIKSMNWLLVPGILQTPEYARAILKASLAAHSGNNQVDQSDLEQAVANRISRWNLLTASNPTIEVLMCESTLRRCVVDHEQMAIQCERIAESTESANVGILPFYQTLPHFPDDGSYVIFDDLVVLEPIAGETIYREPETIAAYKASFDRFSQSAIKGPEASELSHQIAADHRARNLQR